MLDPIMMKQMGDAQLEGLRQQAAIRRALAPEVAWWQRLAGRAMPGAGARLLGDRASVRPLEPAAECE